MEEYSIVSLLNVSQSEEQEGEDHEKLDEFICAHGEMLSDEEGTPNHTPLSSPAKSEADAHRFSPSSPLSCGPTCQPQDAYPISHSCLTLPSEHSVANQSDVYVQPRQLNLSPEGLGTLDKLMFHKSSMLPSDGDLAELEHLRVLCGAQGGRIEQMIKQQAAKEEESERQIRIIRHEKTVAMEELDKMAKLYRELEAAKEGQAREMASLRGLLEEEKVKGQTLDGSRRELISQLQAAEAAKECLTAQVKELSTSDILSRVRDGYASAQTQSKELHDQQLAALKEELDGIRHASDAKTEAIQQLQLEIQELHARLSEGGHYGASPKSLDLDGEEEDLRERLVQLTAHTEDLQYQLTASLEQLEGAEHRAAYAQEALQAQSSELNTIKDDRQYLRDQLNLFLQQMAQLKQDADLDKKTCLDKCRQTLLQLHEDATNRIRQSQLTELQRVEEEHQKQVSRLQGELTAVKEEYTRLCREKNQLAAEQEQAKVKQLGLVTPAERDEALVRAKAEWREHMMKESAAMLEKALQESQRSWELRLEREKAQAVYVIKQEWEGKVEDARRELERIKQSMQLEKDQAKSEAVRLARIQWLRDGDQGLQARTEAAVSVAHKMWKEQEGREREEVVASVRRECDLQMRKAVQETAERVKEECRREQVAEVEAAVARERALVREKEGVKEAVGGKKVFRSPTATPKQKQSGEEGVKRVIQQARVHWEAEQTVATKNAVDKATQAITDHYEGLLRECEGRWRQEAARGREEAARRTRNSHRVLCDFGCQTQLVVMEGLEVKIQERIELTRQSLKRDIAQLLAEKDAMHQAELAQTRISITREVEGVYLRYLEKMADHDASRKVVSLTVTPDDVTKKPHITPGDVTKKPPTTLDDVTKNPHVTATESKKPPRRERSQPTRQPRKTTK